MSNQRSRTNTSGRQWSLTERQRNDLRDVRRDFRERLPDNLAIGTGTVVHAQQTNSSSIPWPDILPPNCHRLYTLAHQIRQQQATTVFFSRDSLTSRLLDRYFGSAAMKAAGILQESQYPGLPPTDNGWIGSLWTACVIEYASAACQPLVLVVPKTEPDGVGNLPSPLMDDVETGKYVTPLDEWAEQKRAFPHRHILVLDDIRSTSVEAIDYLLTHEVGEPATTPQGKNRPSGPKRPVGRPKESDPEQDKRWHSRWEAARNLGTRKAEFAKELGISEGELQKAIDRHSKRLAKAKANKWQSE